MKNHKIFLLILVILFNFQKGITQKLDPPTIHVVSFDYETDSTTIKWIAMDDSLDVDFYSIHIYNKLTSSYDLLTTVTGDKREFTFYSVLEKSAPVKYSMIAESLILENSLYSYAHTTIYSYIEFDPCQSELKIKWTRYIGWTYGVLKYNIYQSINNSPWLPIVDTLVNINDTTTIWNYTLTEIDENSNYCFYIEALNRDQITKSTSNKSCQYTDMNVRPDYINADYATVNSNNQIDLSFTIDPSSEINAYKLLRSTDSGNNFDTIQDINTSERTLELIDSEIDPSTETYTYQLVAINSCGNIVLRSNLASNIVLNVVNQGTVNLLNWNEYQNWNGSIESYTIYRIMDENTVALVTTTNTNFNDNIEIFQNSQMSGQFCYYIEATEGDSNPYGIKGSSKSTSACITLDPIIQIPNAFNPASEISANSCFKPFISYKPSSYSMVVYNRWGGIVFESNDSSIGWDGKLQGNKFAPEGAYIYVLKIVKPNNEVINQEGSLIIVYP